MQNARVFGLSYTSDSDLVRNDKSKPRPLIFTLSEDGPEIFDEVMVR